MARRLPLALRLYQLASVIGSPAAPQVLARRLKRGKEHPERLSERRGEAGVTRPTGPLVWVHGASVGEMLAVVPLIEQLRAQDFAVLVTSGTVTSAALAEQRLPDGAIHQFIPLDAPRFVRRFLDHWRPGLALFVESDLWPNLILSCAERKIPMILINGRLSRRMMVLRGKQCPESTLILAVRARLFLHVASHGPHLTPTTFEVLRRILKSRADHRFVFTPLCGGSMLTPLGPGDRHYLPALGMISSWRGAMRLVTIVLALCFAGMLLEVQPMSARPGKQATPAAAKETKWQGTIIHMLKDQSMMDIRGGATANDSHMLKVAFDSSTQWTKQSKPAEQSEFKEGSFVIVLGKIDDKGILHASHIDLRLPR